MSKENQEQNGILEVRKENCTEGPEEAFVLQQNSMQTEQVK